MRDYSKEFLNLKVGPTIKSVYKDFKYLKALVETLRNPNNTVSEKKDVLIDALYEGEKRIVAMDGELQELIKKLNRFVR